MTFSERLSRAMTEAGYTQGRLAKSVGMAQSSVNKLLNGALSSRKTVEISSVLGVRPEWLSTGEGPMRSKGQPPAAFQSEQKSIYRLEALNVSVSAGQNIINNEFVEIVHSLEYAMDCAHKMFDDRTPEQVRIINIRSDNMSGTIEPGDLIFIDISIKSFDGDGIYAFLYDETVHIKRLQKMKDKLLVISDNKIYPLWEPIERDEMDRVVIFGKVIGSMSQTYKKHG